MEKSQDSDFVRTSSNDDEGRKCMLFGVDLLKEVQKPQEPQEALIGSSSSSSSSPDHKRKRQESSSGTESVQIREERHVVIAGGDGGGSRLDPFTIKKRLTASDVGAQTRLLLHKDDVETHIKPLMVKEQWDHVLDAKRGLRVVINDLDEGVTPVLTLKKLESSRCFIINCNWRENFVRRRNLHEGDKIGLYWDRPNAGFCFRVLECPHLQAVNN